MFKYIYCLKYVNIRLVFVLLQTKQMCYYVRTVLIKVCCVVSYFQTSEDCLYLNVWTPLNATSTSGYPVMVFIHGGAFKWGAGSNHVYNGENLAQTGEVIVVNMNYRIGKTTF